MKDYRKPIKRSCVCLLSMALLAGCATGAQTGETPGVQPETDAPL